MIGLGRHSVPWGISAKKSQNVNEKSILSPGPLRDFRIFLHTFGPPCQRNRRTGRLVSCNAMILDMGVLCVMESSTTPRDLFAVCGSRCSGGNIRQNRSVCVTFFI